MGWGAKGGSRWDTGQLTKFATLSGQRESRATSMLHGGILPAPHALFKTRRVSIRSPNVDPFSKHVQRFLRFLEWFFSTSEIKAEFPLPPPPPPKPACSPGLGMARTSAPRTPARGNAVPPGQKPLARTTPGDEEVAGTSPCSAPPTLHPSLAREKQETHREKVRGGVEGKKV